MKRHPEKTISGRLALMTEDRDYLKTKLEQLQRENSFTEKAFYALSSRFDRLLDGVCAGMKEGNIPRRPY